MIALDTPAKELTRYGKTAASRLKDLGIRTAEDLLRTYPIRYDDLRNVVTIRSVQAGDRITLRGRVELISSRRSFRRHMAITEALLRDSTGAIPLTWFNQSYVGKILKVNDEILVAGRAEEGNYPLHLVNPTYEKIRPEQSHVGAIVPLYSLTHNISQKQLRALIRLVLPLRHQLPDPLPEELRRTHGLVPLADAIHHIHFPGDDRSLSAARRRLQFEELFLFLLQLFATKALIKTTPAPAIPFSQPTVKGFVEHLPFKLTEDQRRAAWEILQAMEKTQPMNRLLEGDVGSGKTVVASIAMINAAQADFQSAFLAPTEVLASQHYRTIAESLQSQNIPVALFTHSQTVIKGEKVTRSKLFRDLANGRVPIVIGTHALLNEKLSFASLGLVVIDEQHRFGVEQRKRLRDQATSTHATMPHLLSMTATPIPRSLALTVYGDLDVSLLKHLPAGRPAVTTVRLKPSERERAVALMKSEITKRHQAFVICPIIEESDRLGVRAATEEFERLSSGPFTARRVGLLHGKLPGKKKIEVLDAFRRGELDVLVATSVVEVGIDNPNATVMLIEGAERFGLAQLHQLRGRIGRGTAAATCLLLAEADTDKVRQRLDALVASRDGFALAELDLKLRGPGELSGQLQSGYLDFHIANLEDLELVKTVRAAAQDLFAKDPTLDSHPLLKLAIIQADVHPE